MSNERLEGDFVVLQGGGKDGWAYTRESIENKVRSERSQGRDFPFVPTGRREDFTYSQKSALYHYEAEIWAYDASKDPNK